MITYESTSMLLDGKVPVGNVLVEQILSSNPPQFFTTSNKGTVGIRKGSVVARHPSGNGVVSAQADALSHAAIGIAAEDMAIGFAATIQTSGLFVLQDWTMIIGQQNLQPMTIYWLSLTPGLITGTSPVVPGQISQQIGVAVSSVALSIDIKYPILL